MTNWYEIKSTNEIIEYIKNKKDSNIIIWGLSEKTKNILNREKLSVKGIIDKNSELVGTTFNGIPVLSIEETLQKDIQLIIWGNHSHSIFEKLSNYFLLKKVIFSSEDLPRFLHIKPQCFGENYSIRKKKEVFKEIVSLIEIEPHSYCNRTCWFCPNSFIDRRTNTNYMDLNILTQLLKDLSTINYDKKIAFTRYSEPFANEIFYDRLNLVHKYLPNATLHANTNSDYLNNESLDRAYSNGLRSLFIQVYLSENETFNFETVDKKAKKIISRISDVNVELNFIRDDWIEYKCSYKDMNIKMYSRDFKINGTNRSNINVMEEENYQRNSPCPMVFTDVYIDYNSNIVPCCNIRSDNKEHSKFTFGTLRAKENSIFELYFSSMAIKWRKKLFNFNLKKFSPCNDCSACLVEDSTFNRLFVDNINKNL